MKQDKYVLKDNLIKIAHIIIILKSCNALNVLIQHIKLQMITSVIRKFNIVQL